ncbi:methionine adenosyltransferase [Georgenia deserti]|uniref:S-adenosylmethionine synthase n=1 Tax=Georgenia deserti TaxID=2093781 RepID=A0ABW4L6X4_9MICO
MTSTPTPPRSSDDRPPLRQFTSESVTEGHPDKICDRISDSILDAILAQDPAARVAVEAMVTTGLVHVAGEVTTEAYVEIPQIVRDEVRRIGYTSSEIGFDGRSCGVEVSIGQQSPDIAGGVDTSEEKRTGAEYHDPLDAQGAGDQGLMFGYACDDTAELMPLPIFLAHRMAERLAQVRKGGLVAGLRPDGKTQVTIGYDGERAVSLDTVVVSTQHDEWVRPDMLASAIRQEVVAPVLDAAEIDLRTEEMRLLVNPTGKFVVGGPMGDAGLTGRKVIVDTYGGMARHGGGAFSGKDPSKVDRSGSYAMRWVAKNVVAAGLASRCEVQVAYAIGRAHPVGLFVETFGTETVPNERIVAAVREVFDLRPAAVVRDLDLIRPIYRHTSAYGHFGRELPEFTWERTDRVDELRAAVG